MKTILHIIDSLGNGGAERVLVTTVKALKKNGIESEVVILFKDDFLAAELESSNIIVHRLYLKHRWHGFGAVNKLRKIITIKRFELVHAHLFFAYFYMSITKKLFAPKLKTVVTLHNMAYEADPADSYLKKIRKRWDKAALYNYNLVLAVSNAVKCHFENELQIKRINLLYNSFPVQELQLNMSDKNDMPELFKKYQYNIVVPGRLVKEKGHEYFFSALKGLKNKLYYNSVGFYIIGDGVLRESIRQQVAALESSNIFILGNLKQQELFKYLYNSSIVVVPSVSEGFGMIVGEAMAMGKPILSTNVGGIPDLIDNNVNGIMVAPKNADALCVQIDKLLMAPDLRERLGRAAAKKALLFDDERISRELIEKYQQL